MNKKPYPRREELVIPSDWAVMGVETDDGLMMIRINRGYEPLMGHPDFSYQIGVSAPLNRPTETGMHDDDEGDEVGEIEDLLVDALQVDNRALFVFTQTSGGVKEWVFYTGEPEAMQALITSVCQRVTSHEIQMIVQHDPEWKTYGIFNPDCHDD